MKETNFKTFEEVYSELTENKGKQIDRQLARHIYEAGIKHGFYEMAVPLSEQGARMNAKYVSWSFQTDIDGVSYMVDFSCLIQKAGAKSMQEIADGVAEDLLKSANAGNLKDLLKKAVLSGYSIRHSDSDEKENDE